MKKMFGLLSVCLLLMIYMSSSQIIAETTSSINVVLGRVKLVVNEQPIAQETLLYNGTTYVPLRTIAEILGKEVSYNPLTQTAYIDENGANRQFSTTQAPVLDSIIGITRKSEYSATDLIKYSNSNYIAIIQVPGSMQNTIKPGDSVIVDKTSYLYEKPERFDVVLLKYNEGETDTHLYRIIGLPGETLDIKKGLVYINNSLVSLNEPYLFEPPNQLDYGPYLIPNNQYFVMGDNRNHSYDSRNRQNTYVPLDNILGKVILIVSGE